MEFYLMLILSCFYTIYKTGKRLVTLNYLSKNGVKTKAEVVENKKLYQDENPDLNIGDSWDSKFFPYIKFTDENEKSHIFLDKDILGATKQRVGRKIKIVYDKNDPSVFFTDFKFKRITTTFFLILSIFTFFAFGYLLVHKTDFMNLIFNFR